MNPMPPRSEWLILYLLLEAACLSGRDNQTLSEAEEDVLLERMDSCWWQLTQEERDWLGQRAHTA